MVLKLMIASTTTTIMLTKTIGGSPFHRLIPCNLMQNSKSQMSVEPDNLLGIGHMLPQHHLSHHQAKAGSQGSKVSHKHSERCTFQQLRNVLAAKGYRPLVAAGRENPKANAAVCPWTISLSHFPSILSAFDMITVGTRTGTGSISPTNTTEL